MKKLTHTIIGTAAIAVLGLGVAACGSDPKPTAASAEKRGGGGKTMTMGLQQPWSSLPMYVAQHEGFMAKHGIKDIKVVKFTDLPALTTALTRGQVDGTMQTMTLLTQFNEKSQDAQLRFFDAGQNMASMWVTAKDSDIPVAQGDDWQSTVKAFKGKKIGVGARGGINELMTSYLAKQVGLDPERDLSYTLVAAGPAQVGALKNGVVDVTAGDAFGAMSIVKSGVGQPALDFIKGPTPPIYKDTMLSGYIASQQALDADPELYRGFQQALAEARTFMADPANEEAVKKVIVSDIGADQALADLLYPTIASFQLKLTPELVGKTADALVQSGLITPSAAKSDMTWAGAGS